MGVELLKSTTEGSESILKTLWHHSDAIMCCSMKVCIFPTTWKKSECLNYNRFIKSVNFEKEKCSSHNHIQAIQTNSQFIQALPVFTFANQAGLDMLETTLVALQDITLEKIFDDHGRKTLCSEFPQIMQQVRTFPRIHDL